MKRFRVRFIDNATAVEGEDFVEADDEQEAKATFTSRGKIILSVEDWKPNPVPPSTSTVQPLPQDHQLRCPYCGSTYLTANKKGFSLTKAVVGVLVAGPLGAVAGAHRANDIIITCLSCGRQCLPGS